MRVVLLLLLAGCAPAAEKNPDPRPHGGADTGEDATFLRADSVQITDPANGGTVSSPFVLTFAAGQDVDHVSLSADGAVVGTAAVADGALTVTLDDGLHALDLVGYDAAGSPLSHHAESIRVAAEGATWVTVQSPASGAAVYNPVTFVVARSDDLARVDVYVDGALLGSTDDSGVLVADVPGEGAAHYVDARGYNADGRQRASDGLTFTVEPGESPAGSDFNAIVLDTLAGYATDGSHGYYWPSGGDWYGTTQDITYRGQVVAEGDPEGRCYCVGLTWEVMMRAFEAADAATGGDGTLNGLSVAELDEFRIDWFVRDLYGDGVVTALQNYGLGQPVRSWSDVEPGDFVQFWRNSGSGHSVIFMNWVTNSAGDIAGFRYWSTQSSTDGIAYNTEYFGTTGSSVDATHFFVARAVMPDAWTDYR